MRHRGLGFIRNNLVGLFSVACVLLVTFFAAWFSFSPKQTYQANAEVDLLEELNKLENLPLDGRFYLKSDWFSDFEYDENYDVTYLQKSDVKSILFLKGTMSDYFPDYWEDENFLDIWMYEDENDSQGQNSCQATYTLDEDGLATIYVVGSVAITAPENSSRLFAGFENLETLYLEIFVADKTTDMSFMFAENPKLKELYMPLIESCNATNMSGMFYNDISLENLDVSCLDTSNVEDMTGMFSNCQDLKSIDVSTWDTSNVLYMGGMFSGCEQLKEIDLSTFDTSNVTIMNSMFAGCSQATYFNLEGWDTTNVVNFQQMFASCYKLKSLDLSPLNMRSGTNFSDFFNGTVNLERLVAPREVVMGAIEITASTPLYKVMSSGTGKTVVSKIDANNCSTDEEKLFLVSGVAITIVDNLGNGISFQSVVLDNNNFTLGIMLKNAIDLTLPEVVKDGYKFVGWEMDAHYVTSGGFSNAVVTLTETADFKYVLHVEKITCAADIILTANYLKLEGFLPEKLLCAYDNAFISREQCEELEEVYFLYELPGGSISEDCFKINIEQPNISKDLPGKEVYADVFLYMDEINENTGYYKKMYVVCNYELYAPQNCTEMFYGLTNLKKIVFENFNTSYTEEFVRMFGCCDSIEMMDLSTFDMSSARNLAYMFEDCVSLVYPIFYTWNTESVTDVSGLFRGCKELSVVHMANFDLSNCGSAINMFEYCESLVMLTSPYAIGDFEIDLSFKYFVSEDILKPDVDQQVPDFELLPEHLDVVEYITKDSCGNDKYADHNMMVSLLVIKIYLNGKYEFATEMFPSSKSFLASQGIPVVDGWVEENTQDLFNVGVEILSCDTTLLSTGDFTIDESLVRVKVNSSGFVSIDVDIEYADFLTLSTEWSYRLNVSRSQIREITILNGSPENYGIDSNSCVHISTAGGVDENGEQIIPDSSKALLGRVEYDEDPDGTRFAIVYIYAPGNKIFAPPDSTELFADCENMTTLNLGGLDTSYTYSMNRMFGDALSLTSIDVSNFNTENVVDMRTMFAGCKSLTELDVSNFNTELVESFYGMFGNCHLVEDLDLGNFVTTIADDMSYMFYGCTNLTNLNILSFDTQNVVGMAHMFFECAGLTELDLSHFDTDNVESMSGMFAGASNLENINFEGFATSNLVNMYGMFEGCSSLKIVDLSPFNLTNVTDMSYMFYGCELLEECLIRSSTLSLQQATEMFVGCTNLIYLDLYGLDLSQVSDINDFLADCKNLLEIVVPLDVGDNVIALDGCFVNGLTDEIVTEITQAVCDVKDEDGNNTFLARALIIEIYVNGEFIGDEWSPVDEVGIEINVCEWIGSYYFAEAEVTIDNSECNKTLTYENPMLIIPAAATGVVGLYFQFQPKDVFLATDWFEVITKSMESEGKEPISFGQVAEIYIVDELHFSSVRPPVLLWTGSVGVTDADGSDYDTSFTAVTADVIDVGEGMISIYLYSNFGNIICAPKEASELFFNFYNMTTFQLNDFNTSYAVNMVGMFDNCSSLSELDLSGFDTSNAVDLSCMFANCANLTNLDLDNFDTTNVESMREMFAHCESLGMLYLDSFDTSEVQNFAEMFMGCTNLMWVDMSSFDMSNQLFTMIDKQGFAESFFADCENLRRIDIPYIMGDFEIVLPTGYFALENDYSYSRQLTLQQSMCSGSKETLKTLFSILLAEWTINGELMPIEGCEVRLIEEVSVDLVQLFGDRYKVDVIEIKSELICGDVTVDGQYLTIANGSCGLFRIEVLLVDGEAWLRQDWFKFTTISKDQVESIKVVRDLPEEVTSTGVDVGCADTKGDISKDFDPVYVYCQQKQNELYDVYIYTPYILYAPENSSSLFANFANATVIDVGHLNTSFVTDMSLMFRGCSVVGTLELGGFDTTNVTTMNNMFESCDRAVIIDVSGFVTKNVTDFSHMFYNCRLLRELDVSGFETPIATNMSHMFDLADDNSYKRVFVDVSNFDTANVTNMSYMFNNVEVRANDLATFDTSKVEDMAGMFYRCYISGDTDVLMLDNFDTINVTNMASMFNQTRSSAKKLDLRNFDTSKTVYMNDMFMQSSFTEIDISNFDTSSLVSASGMFERGLLTSIDISHFDMSKIKNISHMFLSCDNLEEIKFNPLMDGIKIEYASQAFSYCQKLTVLDLSWIDLGDYKDGRDIKLTSGSANLKKLLLPQNLQENSSIFLSNKHNLYFETTKEYAGLYVFAGQESVSKANPTVLVYRSNLIVDYGYDQAVENRYYFYSQESQTVDLGTLERDGFAFAGWEFVSGDASVEANQMTIEGDAFEDITVKALWTEVFKIDLSVSNLDSKGKPIKGVPTINISSFNKLDGDTLGELPEPTLKGYIFEGWYLDENFTEKVYEGMTVSADMVLYAKWTKKSIGWILYLGLALLAVIVGLVAALVIFDSKKSKHKKLLDHEKSLFARIMEILTGRKWKKK